MTNSQTIYAACIPRVERDALTDFRSEDFISEEKNVILKLAKKFKGTRFKCFGNVEDALIYVDSDTNLLDVSGISLNGFESSPSSALNEISLLKSTQNNSSNLPNELPISFPSIPIPKLSIFRRVIQDNNIEVIKKSIWNNPRYLINYTNDTPTILMISGHYNAVHIAVRTGATDALKYILKTIDSLEFMSFAYGTSNKEELEEKRERMLDLYLNTPDKVINNSPLHFACSNGFIECVRILIEYVPKCDIEYRNKNGKTCVDVIKDDHNAEKMISLFNDCMYVAIVRSNDELEYQVQLPCYGKKNLDNSFDPKNYHVSALAGPMSPQSAKTLYQTIASPKHCTPEHREIRLRDPVRGVEKVVHKLTFELDVDFAQYWSFIGECGSICSKEVLDRIEAELHKQHDIAYINEIFEELVISLNETKDKVNVRQECVDKETDDCQDLFYTPPTSPLLNELIRTENFFIISSKCQQLDIDVKEALEIAINNESLELENLKLYYPFLYYWLLKFK